MDIITPKYLDGERARMVAEADARNEAARAAKPCGLPKETREALRGPDRPRPWWSKLAALATVIVMAWVLVCAGGIVLTILAWAIRAAGWSG